jgi:ribonuclease HI
MRNLNNVAEYAGLIAVLEWFTQRELFDADITIRGDSLLAIQQMFGAWKIKNGIYAPLAYKARGPRTQFTNMRGEWIERDHNQIADGLAKAAVERAGVRLRLQPA